MKEHKLYSQSIRPDFPNPFNSHCQSITNPYFHLMTFMLHININILLLVPEVQKMDICTKNYIEQIVFLWTVWA